MEDREIIELYFSRSEEAIEQTQRKYSKYCVSIAYNILNSYEDAKECENDAYSRVWDSVPPKRPNSLKAYIGRIVRNLSLDKYRANNAEKRGEGNISLVIDELHECLPSGEGNIADAVALRDALNAFLKSLPQESMRVFVRRYWYSSSIGEIAGEYSMSESKVKSLLFRTRKNLKSFLEKEGIVL